MNQIALPSGGWLKYASFGGKVVERADGACPECALFRTAGVTRPRCEHHFVERSAFGLKIVEAPIKYAALLDAYKKAVSVQRVAPMNPEFSFYRVMALHGDWPNTNGDLFRWGSKTDSNEPELLRLIREGCLEGKHVYQTFTGKGNYKDHNNSKVADAVGIILDAVPNHKVKGIEILIAVDRTKDPMLVRGIDSGYITDVSMGSRVAYSICTICANIAHNEAEYCFVPGTEISLADGTVKRIENISVGEKVLTSRGRFRRVIDTMSRKFDGSLVSIQTFGEQRHLRTTPNHGIYVWNGAGLEKKRADSVREGDYVAFPVNSEASDSVLTPEMCFVLGMYTAEGCVSYQKRRLRPVSTKGKEKLISYLNDGQWHGVMEVARKFRMAPASTHNFYDSLIRYGYGQRNEIGKFLLTKNPVLDPEYMKKPTGVEFSLHVKEMGIVKELESTIGRVSEVYKRGNGMSARFHDSALASLCIQMVGTGARTKKLSDVVMGLPQKHQSEFMRGWLLGDGHCDEKNHHAVLSTASPSLARQAQVIGARLGGSPVCSEIEQVGGPTDRDKLCTIYQVHFRKKDSAVVSLAWAIGSSWNTIRSTCKSVLRINGLVLRQVVGIVRVPYIGPVYNIEVEEDHTYVANGVAVSNCNHVKNWKGQNYSGPETGWKNVLAAEDNRGVEFIEESWVTVGADTKAKHLEKIAALCKVKGMARMAEILTEAESELNKNCLCDWQKVNNLMDMGIAQAILA